MIAQGTTPAGNRDTVAPSPGETRHLDSERTDCLPEMARTDPKILYLRAQFLLQLGRDLERISLRQDTPRVVRFALRKLGEILGADLVVQMDIRRPDGGFEAPYLLALTSAGKAGLRRNGGDGAGRPPSPLEGARFHSICRDFLQRSVDPEDRRTLLLRIRSEDRDLSLLGFCRIGGQFSREETRLGLEAAEILSENLRHRMRERAQELNKRILAKVLREMRPQDVLYQILHGLKRLVQYDHGGTVLLLDPREMELVVQAEIIAWEKAKSDRIGRRIPFSPAVREWMEQTGRSVMLLAGRVEGGLPLPPELEEPLLMPLPDAPASRGAILAVLRHRSHLLGILVIRSRSAAAFTPSDLRILDDMLPLASVTVFNSELYKTQQEMLTTVERKAALADLARAISHDLNNAFGVMMPLLQALKRDAADGDVCQDQLRSDLAMIEHYASYSARIFQGLLSVARGSAEPASWCDLNSVLEAILGMIGPSLEAKGIRIGRDFNSDLPTVFVRRSEMEQLFLNLVYNARDAMRGGGVLTVRTRRLADQRTGEEEWARDGIRAEVQDTGQGIPEEIRARIFEPFFTTKETGSGLGLDICRSIVWDYDGRLELDSVQGSGTTAVVWLPRLADRLRAEAEAVTPLHELPHDRPHQVPLKAHDGDRGDRT